MGKIYDIRGSWRDLNCKMKGPETFRKVWRGGAWKWIAGYMGQVSIRASDRKAEARGPVEVGEVVAQFGRYLPDRKCDLEKFWEVKEKTEEGNVLESLHWERKTLTTYEVTKLNGEKIEVPDPLARD